MQQGKLLTRLNFITRKRSPDEQFLVSRQALGENGAVRKGKVTSLYSPLLESYMAVKNIYAVVLLLHGIEKDVNLGEKWNPILSWVMYCLISSGRVEAKRWHLHLSVFVKIRL